MHRLAFLMTCVLSGCGVGKTGNLLGTQFTGAGFEAFKNTVYPVARTKCIACHGAGQSPVFASASVSQAYQVMRWGKTPSGYSVASVEDPTSSRVLVRALETTHCPLCGTSTQSTLSDALTTWSAVEVALGNTSEGGTGTSGGSGSYIEDTEAGTPLSSNQVPANLFSQSCTENGNPNCGVFASVTSTLVPGVNLIVEVQVYFNGYRVGRIRLAQTSSSSVNLHVRDIRVLLNGWYYPHQQSYRSIDAMYTGGSVVLSDADVIFPQINGSASPFDFISVKVGSLQ